MRRILLSTMIGFYLLCNSFIVDEFMREWEVKPKDTLIYSRQYEYGIVLGGIMSGYVYSGKQIIFNRSVDRLMQTIVLFKKGVIKKIVYTGGSGSIIQRDMIEAVFVREYLLSIGIPDSCLIIECESKNTYENAVRTAEIIGIDSDRKDLLITSGYHMRRSIACFEHEGFNVDPYAVDLCSGKRKYVFDHMFMPDFKALEKWNLLIHEWLGFISYRFAGYL